MFSMIDIHNLPRPFLEALARVVKAHRLHDEAIEVGMPKSSIRVREMELNEARAALGDQTHDLLLAGEDPALTDEDLEARGVL